MFDEVSGDEAFFAACRRALAVPADVFDAGRRRLFSEHGWPIQRERIQDLYREACKKIGKA